MKTKNYFLFAWCFLVLMSACGKSGTSVTSNASIFNGATTAAATMNAIAPASHKRVHPTSVPADGTWYISPDKMIFSITKIQLGNEDAASVTCSATYDASKPGLTKLTDCPFTAKTGTYENAEITISQSYQVLINDTTNGFFTTSSGIVTTAPNLGAENNGAEFYTFTSTNTVNTQKFTQFATPLEVTATNVGNLNMVINGLQFFRVDVSGGTATVFNGGNESPANIPDMIVTHSDLAKLAYYSASGINSAATFKTGSGATGVISAAVFYTDATTPYWIQFGLNGSTDGCSMDGAAGAMSNSTNGYLGLDTNKVLGWALGTWSQSAGGFTSYHSEFSMQEVDTIGQSTSLKCATITADPAPSGGSYSSGAPTGGTTIATMYLVAQ